MLKETNLERKQKPKLGGRMKKVLLISLIVLAFVFVFAGSHDVGTPNLLNAKTVNPGVKDSLAQAAGGVGLLWLNGTYALFPGAAPNMAYDTISGWLQIGAAQAYGAGDEFAMTYLASNDNGATWTTPVDLMASMHSESRSLNSFAISADGYPYAMATWRNGSTRGAFFMADGAGPNGGSWSSPIQIGDTLQWTITNYSTVTVNPLGDKVAFFGWNDYWSFGTNSSADYGGSWSGYIDNPIINPDSNTNIYVTDISTARWADGDNVYGIVGLTPMDYAAAYDAGQGTTFGIVISNDGGATWNQTLTPAFNGEWWPDVPGMGIDTFYYLMDTIDNEDASDAVSVKAWWDATTGVYVDEWGNIDGMAVAPGTWWHKWDAEYVNGKLYVVAPFQMVTIDYITEGDLYTFPDYWDNIMYGVMDIAGGETEFTWTFCDVKCEVLDTLGNIDTYRGYQGTSQLCYDWRNDVMYVVYEDIYDINTGLPSHELMAMLNDGRVYRVSTPPVVNSGVSNAMQTPNIVDEDGVIHNIFRPTDADSIYYIAIDVDDYGTIGDTLLWDPIAGITNNEINDVASVFSIPSIIRTDGEIAFTLSNSENVSISLFDLTGREVKVLANRNFDAGTHSVRINSNDMSQGVYFAKIKTDTRTESKKVIIVK